MRVLDEHLIGPKHTYLCGDQMTIADYFGASFVALGELIRGDYAAFPNVERWLAAMKRLQNWSKVNEVIHGFAASLNDTSLQPLWSKEHRA
jgi:glutathione S-transferase